MRSGGGYSVFSGVAAGGATPRAGARLRRWFVVPAAMGAGASVTIVRDGGATDVIAIPAGAGPVEALPDGNSSCLSLTVGGDVVFWLCEVVR